MDCLLSVLTSFLRHMNSYLRPGRNHEVQREHITRRRPLPAETACDRGQGQQREQRRERRREQRRQRREERRSGVGVPAAAEPSECPICLQPVRSGQVNVVRCSSSRCRATYHRQCFCRWLAQQPSVRQRRSRETCLICTRPTVSLRLETRQISVRPSCPPASACYADTLTQQAIWEALSR